MARTATRNPRRRYRRRREVERDSDAGSSTDNNGFQALQSDTGSCCTPKGKGFKISEISACPPAPMKPKVAPKMSLSTRTFIASQDVEIFFFLAFQKCH
ncbi:putative Curculin-like lectin family protein / PAN domain-containing protein [Hibiscus syriacus]|uniref:Curculin-like lectin family protein / PAN domain-containing protein n=1 Tax=Hibiscus syriacus TaxID=106335 RepID=A0A6A3CDE0_HIBSY|nr:cyclin-dependent protein kinase inhibitor SMR13-like [Hibiscus syriacus]KAE8725159.1 putative Curculin-like lectin family protein / PAN domain-containing protein [Hibiscus syriacus]